MKEIASMIAEVLNGMKSGTLDKQAVAAQVQTLCARFPLYQRQLESLRTDQ